MSRDLSVTESVFEDGESPLKESRDISIADCLFKWKYPLWYCKNVSMRDSTFFRTARAGVWYTDSIAVKNCVIDAPKTFRRSRGIVLDDVLLPEAAETLWACRDVSMNNVTVRGDYFAMNSEGIAAKRLDISGDYCFDGAKRVEIRNARIISKDAFWNSSDVTVYDSFVSGEYLGWNSERLTLVNCTVESLQGLCYIDSLTMKNCKLINTTLAFEYSTVDADIAGGVDSVLNPSGGRIVADEIGELIIQKDRVDPDKTVIVCRGKA